MTSFATEARNLIDRHRTASASSARVLLTTVFGDSLRPRDQAISVQDLAGLVEPMGMNERLVRTSLHRMANEGLVMGDRVGRRSFYSVAPDAVETFENADQRIYTHRQVEWDGLWTLVVIDPRGVDGDARARLARELDWLGMRRLLPGVLTSPTLEPAAAKELAERLDVPVSLIVRGPLFGGTLEEALDLASLDNPESHLHELYGRHLSDFCPLADAADAATMAPIDAFSVRTLLIDGWRRLALRSTDLPSELLPEGWRADDAHRTTSQLYRALWAPSEAHLDSVLGRSEKTPTPRFSDC